MFCDNSSAIDISKNLAQHSPIKHIDDIKLQFIRDLVVKILICITHIFTENQLAEYLPRLLILRDFSLLESLLICACCKNFESNFITPHATS